MANPIMTKITPNLRAARACLVSCFPAVALEIALAFSFHVSDCRRTNSVLTCLSEIIELVFSMPFSLETTFLRNL